MSFETETRCNECNRTVKELNKKEIVFEDGHCEECSAKLMKEWEQEQKELMKYWEDTRL